MRRLPALLMIPACLLIAGCSSTPDLADVMDTCQLEDNAWSPDDHSIVVGMTGVSPETREQVQCLLDETGASSELQHDIWVDTSAAGAQPNRVQMENGLRYSWSWVTLGNAGLTLIVSPE